MENIITLENFTSLDIYCFMSRHYWVVFWSIFWYPNNKSYRLECQNLLWDSHLLRWHNSTFWVCVCVCVCLWSGNYVRNFWKTEGNYGSVVKLFKLLLSPWDYQAFVDGLNNQNYPLFFLLTLWVHYLVKAVILKIAIKRWKNWFQKSMRLLYITHNLVSDWD